MVEPVRRQISSPVSASQQEITSSSPRCSDAEMDATVLQSQYVF